VEETLLARFLLRHKYTCSTNNSNNETQLPTDFCPPHRAGLLPSHFTKAFLLAGTFPLSELFAPGEGRSGAWLEPTGWAVMPKGGGDACCPTRAMHWDFVLSPAGEIPA